MFPVDIPLSIRLFFFLFQAFTFFSVHIVVAVFVVCLIHFVSFLGRRYRFRARGHADGQ